MGFWVEMAEKDEYGWEMGPISQLAEIAYPI